MANRDFYLAAYDIADPARLRRALEVVKTYALGGQKSVYECYLTPAERQVLLKEVESVMDKDEDRFLLLRLDPRMRVHTLGIAVPPVNPGYFYVG